MKAWITVMTNRSEPTQKVYLVGAHSSKADADNQAKELSQSSGNSMEVISMNLDTQQPPILVGVANSDNRNDCKKNTPNG